VAQKICDSLELTNINESLENAEITQIIKEYNKSELYNVREENKKKLSYFNENLKGYYFCWFNWVNRSNPEKNIYKTLIKIEKINYLKSYIVCKMSTKRHFATLKDSEKKTWGYNGVLSPFGDKSLFFAFENADYKTGKMGYTTLQMKNYSGDSCSQLRGIYTAETALYDKHIPAPTSSRVFMQKITNMTVGDEDKNELDDVEIEKINELGWYSEKEIEEYIVNKIKNQIDSYGVLSIQH